MIYKYIRSSIENESIEKQKEAMRQIAGNEVIEIGKNISKEMLDNLKPGDSVFVKHLDRITSGEVDDGLRIYQYLHNNNIKLYVQDKEINLVELIEQISKHT